MVESFCMYFIEQAWTYKRETNENCYLWNAKIPVKIAGNQMERFIK